MNLESLQFIGIIYLINKRPLTCFPEPMKPATCHMCHGPEQISCLCDIGPPTRNSPMIVIIIYIEQDGV